MTTRVANAAGIGNHRPSNLRIHLRSIDKSHCFAHLFASYLSANHPPLAARLQQPIAPFPRNRGKGTRGGHGMDRVHYRGRSAYQARIARQKSGRSEGLRLLIEYRSTTTGASSQIAPAFTRSSLIPKLPVTRIPR